MSDNITYDFVCNVGSCINKMKIEEMSITENKKGIANVIAGEVVNEILESALDIATRATETGIHWRIIKEERSNSSINKSRSFIDMEQDQYEDTMDMFEGTEIIQSEVKTEPLLNEDEKRFFSEGTCESAPIRGGVGDQPAEEKDSFFEETVLEKPITVERKSRVIDLVKNSGQVLTEYILNEKLKQTQDEWEESEEKLIQIIDLECPEPTENKNYKRQSPEDTPLPDDDDDLIEIPQDNVMDVIDLSTKAFQEEESQINSEIVHSGGKGDEFVNYNMIVVMPPHEAPPNTECENILREQDSVAQAKAEAKETKTKKKKWNIGTRLMSFLKRHPKDTN